MILRNSLQRLGSQHRALVPLCRSRLGSRYNALSNLNRNDVQTPIHAPTRLSNRQSVVICQSRSFHSSPKSQDVFFFALPALKGALLNVTRVSLITLPFIWRWRQVPARASLCRWQTKADRYMTISNFRLWQKYRRTSMILVNLPVSTLLGVAKAWLAEAKEYTVFICCRSLPFV